MKYFILEHQKRADGEINVSEVSRSTLESAISYYYERFSKMAVTDLYTDVALSLVDEKLNVIKHDIAKPIGYGVIE